MGWVDGTRFSADSQLIATAANGGVFVRRTSGEWPLVSASVIGPVSASSCILSSNELLLLEVDRAEISFN